MNYSFNNSCPVTKEVYHSDIISPMDDIDIKKYPWFSPTYVLHAHADIVRLFGQRIVDTKTDFQRVGEMRKSAIMALALHKRTGMHLLMQASRETFPDVLTLELIESLDKPVHGNYHTVEIVDFGKNGEQDIAQFLLDIKLKNKKKAYDEDTIILCYINKPFSATFDEIYKKLKREVFKPKIVYILGRRKDNGEYLLTQIFPEVAHITLDALAQSKIYPPPLHSTFTLSSKKKIEFVKNKGVARPTGFEVFGLNEAELRKKFNK